MSARAIRSIVDRNPKQRDAADELLQLAEAGELWLSPLSGLADASIVAVATTHRRAGKSRPPLG